MATGVWAAKKIDLVSSNSASYVQRMNSQSDHGHAKMGAIFGLTTDEKFTKVRQTKDFNSVTHTRYVQSFKGIPVWGSETVVSKDHTDEENRWIFCTGYTERCFEHPRLTEPGKCLKTYAKRA